MLPALASLPCVLAPPSEKRDILVPSTVILGGNYKWRTASQLSNMWINVGAIKTAISFLNKIYSLINPWKTTGRGSLTSLPASRWYYWTIIITWTVQLYIFPEWAKMHMEWSTGKEGGKGSLLAYEEEKNRIELNCSFFFNLFVVFSLSQFKGLKINVKEGRISVSTLFH